jgi:hypothetical protein
MAGISNAGELGGILHI